MSLEINNCFVFNLLIINIYSYIENGFTCRKAAIFWHHISAVAQNADLLRII